MSVFDTTPDECFQGIKLLDGKNYFHELMILICIYHCIMLACIGTQMNVENCHYCPNTFASSPAISCKPQLYGLSSSPDGFLNIVHLQKVFQYLLNAAAGTISILSLVFKK